MDRAEAIKFAEEMRDKLSYRLECAPKVPARSYYEKQYEMLNRAIAAMREQEQSNEPLTLEELRNMGGEPAYCADYDLWGIVNIGICGQWKDKPFIGGYSRSASFNYDIEMRGLTLYRHKPKEGAER